MNEKEKLVSHLSRTADIARGLNKTARILGIQRDSFIQMLEDAANEIREQQAGYVPFSSSCPTCKKRFTVALVNGMRKVKWDG